MGNRDELIAQLNDSFQHLLAAVQDLSDDQMTSVWFGDWGVREILAHVAGWHWEMSKALERLARYGEGRTAARLLAGTGFGHYQEHLPQIREWRQWEGI